MKLGAHTRRFDGEAQAMMWIMAQPSLVAVELRRVPLKSLQANDRSLKFRYR